MNPCVTCTKQGGAEQKMMPIKDEQGAAFFERPFRTQETNAPHGCGLEWHFSSMLLLQGRPRTSRASRGEPSGLERPASVRLRARLEQHFSSILRFRGRLVERPFRTSCGSGADSSGHFEPSAAPGLVLTTVAVFRAPVHNMHEARWSRAKDDADKRRTRGSIFRAAISSARNERTARLWARAALLEPVAPGQARAAPVERSAASGQARAAPVAHSAVPGRLERRPSSILRLQGRLERQGLPLRYATLRSRKENQPKDKSGNPNHKA